jgi:hypothetical protein
VKCETPNTGNRGRRGRSTRIYPQLERYCTAVPSQRPKNETQKKTHRHKGTKKSGLGKGWCGKFEKKNNEHITGCGISANRVPRFPLFPPSTLPLDNNSSFIWISQSCGKENGYYSHIHETLDFDEMDGPMKWKELDQEEELVNVAIQLLEVPDMIIEEVHMTEIQLRRIVDRTAKEQQAHQSDGDETITKNGQMTSKFSKEAMNIGDEVYEHEVILRKVFLVHDKWVGNDSILPLSNGAPKIMTKFKDKPYSYELLPEYLHGEKKFPCVKAMNWEGKTARCSVIRGLVKATPVVERCSQQPLCISRLVIAPKVCSRTGKERSGSWF